MKIRNNFFGFIILGIAFILGGLFFAWYKSPVILTFNSAEKAYNDGYIFTYDTNNYDDSLYAIAVYSLSDTQYGTDDGKSEIYTLVADDAVYLLEANPNNKDIVSLLELYGEYYSDENAKVDQAPVSYLIVKAHPDIYGQLSDVLDEIDPEHSYRNDGTIRYDIYLKKTSLGFEILFALGGTLILIAIGIGLIFTAIKRKNDNLASYDKLCELDERLRDNVGELDTISDYVDKNLGAYIFKNHLILNTPFGFDMFDLSKIVWIYHHITKHRLYFFITVSKDFALQINMFENGKFREQRVMLSNNKRAEDAIEALMEYIITNYPNAMVGYSDDNRRAYGEFKQSHK